MNVKPIPAPLPGEHVVGVAPPLTPFVASSARRRPNVYPGRALSDVALALDQSERADRLALRGQTLSAGVVRGLGVRLDTDTAGNPMLYVDAGMGLAATGEDVNLARPLRVRLDFVDLFAPAPVSAPTPAEIVGPVDLCGPPPLPPAVLAPEPIFERVDRFDAVAADPIKAARRTAAAFLVLQPVVAEMRDGIDPADPAPLDPDVYAFVDHQIVDGCRLLLCAWPEAWLPMPQPGTPQWQSRLAHAIFERERDVRPGRIAPWERLGVPIGLVGFDAQWQPLFVDRAAVVRVAGVPPRRTTSLLRGPDPRAEQARIRQFSEQLAALDPARLAKDPAVDPAAAVADFRYLPPVGMLPNAAVDVIGWTRRFFPPSFSIDVVPVPLDQVDTLVAASASLAPFDTLTFDRVRLLVPVPQAVFEPGLLDLKATVDPAFEAAVERAFTKLLQAHAQAKVVRSQAAAILDALGGKDPNRLPVAYSPEVRARLLSLAGSGVTLIEILVALAILEIMAAQTEPSYGVVGGRVQAVDALFESWPDSMWEPLHAPPGAVAAPDPTVVSWGAGRLDVFVRGKDDAIWHRAYNGASWTDWESLGVPSPSFIVDPVTQQVVYASSPVALASSIGHLSVFVRGADGYLRRTSLDTTSPNAVWTPWDLPGTLQGQPDVKIVGTPAVVAWGPFPTIVMARAESDLTFRFIFANNIGFWSPWLHPSAIPLASDPVAVSGGGTNVDAFARSATGQLVHWRGVGPLVVQDILGDQLSSPPAVVTWGPGRIDVFAARITPDQLWHISYDHGIWSAWEELDTMRESATLHAYSWGAGRIDLLARGSDNRLWHKWYDGAWHDWAALSDAISSEPAAVSWGPGRLDVFAVRPTDGGLWHKDKLTADVFASFEKAGVVGLIAELDSVVSRVDDTVNLGFLNVQSAIYRLRQVATKADSASRLVTSPILAEIAQGQSAIATKDDIRRFFEESKLVSLPATPPALLPFVPVAPIPTFGPATATAALSLLGGPAPPATPVDAVQSASPIVGAPPIQRTISLADRLKIPPAIEAKQFAVSIKHSVLSGLANLPVDTTGISVPAGMTGAGRSVVPLADLRSGAVLDGILAEPDPADADESSFFALAVENLEHALIGLRAIEGRAEAQRGLKAVCQSALVTLSALAAQVDKRLKAVDDQIRAYEQEVVVARSLLAEEKARVAAVAARRRAVLANRVPFLVFQRPRGSDLFMDTPVHALVPAAPSAALPAALASTAAAPPELHAFVELFRDAPVAWFTFAPPLLSLIDRLAALQRTIRAAQARAVARPPGTLAMAGPTATALALAIMRTFAAHAEVVSGLRRATAALDPETTARLAWTEANRRATAFVSLGDIVDADHGRSDVARQAALELEHIARVGTALYLGFGAVTPAIRLDWAEQLSREGAAVDLRRLASLPRWDEVAIVERRDLQALATWLFGRVDPAAPQAVQLMNDLVRVALLLASHAPVREIISGHVPRPTAAAVGGNIDVAVDHEKIRIGMHALVTSGSETLHAVVDDIAEGIARLRVVVASAPTVHVTPATLVSFAEPARGASLFSVASTVLR